MVSRGRVKSEICYTSVSMSPIEIETVGIEHWTGRTGKVKHQVVAEGDREDPGTFVLTGHLRGGDDVRLTRRQILGLWVDHPGVDKQPEGERWVGVWTLVRRR